MKASTAMYHTIVFDADMWVDLELSPRQPLERMKLRRGTKMVAQIRPHVIETIDGPIEVADLFFDDGTAARDIPFSHFAFVD
jgi:hypothetical protein